MSLSTLRKNFKKDFGVNSVKAGDEITSIERISSFGSLALDTIVNGGIPRNRMIEYYGNPSGGKTTLSIITGGEVQKVGGVVAFIDLENSADPVWFQELGLDLSEDKFLLLTPETGEDALQMIEDCIVSNEIDLIILDSVATLTTSAEMEGGYGTGQHMAQLSRLLSEGLKKLNAIMRVNTRATVLFLNQIRSSMDKYKPDESTGGNALKHYCSLRLQVQRVGGKSGIIGDPDSPEGFKTRVKVIKSKVSPPLKVIETALYVGPDKFGVDKNEEVVDVAISIGLIKRLSKDKATGDLIEDPKGTYYQIGDEDPIFGRPKFISYIQETDGIVETLKKQIEVFTMNVNKPEADSFASVVQEEE